MIHLVPLLLSCALATDVPPAQAPTVEEERVFVFAFTGDGVEPRLLRVMERAVVGAAEEAGKKAVSHQDLTAILDVEAGRQASGCEGQGACLAEIADGLGAAKVITGAVSRLDSGIDIALTLLDKNGVDVVGRAQATAAGNADIATAAGLAGRRLFGLEPAAGAASSPSSSLRPVLLGVGIGATALGLVGLVGLVPLVEANTQAQNASAAADAFAESGATADFKDLGAAHDAHEEAAAAWNSWGVTSVAVGAAVVATGLVVVVVGALQDTE